ncbi:DUF5825 family protein [Phaeobacter sp.]|uniref:DUF5825 family protein n=1 Tax=Phaeobacter sp. TaxID=1902409 RepID=UPI0025FBD973|nr:DUF5825 family protein [Phaeobacter sp.]
MMLDQHPIPTNGWSPLAGPLGSGTNWAADFLREANQAAQLQYNLGTVDLNDPAQAAALVNLAEARLKNLYGFRLKLRIAHTVSTEQAALLASVGAIEVSVDPLGSPIGALEDRANALSIQSVRALAEQEVTPHWSLSAKALTLDEIRAVMTVTLQLPPPSAILNGPEGSSEILGQWQKAATPQCCSYARGPGFLRVLDRRQGARDWRFVVLNEAQAQILLTCREAQTVDSLAAMDVLPVDAINSVLGALQQYGLVLISGDTIVSVVPRRHFSERWASGDH